MKYVPGFVKTGSEDAATSQDQPQQHSKEKTAGQHFVPVPQQMNVQHFAPQQQQAPVQPPQNPTRSSTPVQPLGPPQQQKIPVQPMQYVPAVRQPQQKPPANSQRQKSGKKWLQPLPVISEGTVEVKLPDPREGHLNASDVQADVAELKALLPRAARSRVRQLIESEIASLELPFIHSEDLDKRGSAHPAQCVVQSPPRMERKVPVHHHGTSQNVPDHPESMPAQFGTAMPMGTMPAGFAAKPVQFAAGQTVQPAQFAHAQTAHPVHTKQQLAHKPFAVASPPDPFRHGARDGAFSPPSQELSGYLLPIPIPSATDKGSTPGSHYQDSDTHSDHSFRSDHPNSGEEAWG